MAKAKYGGGVQDLRGSIAGQVHSRNTYGNYVRQKVSPVQPRTSLQLEVRELFSTLSRRFSNVLTDEQQEAWRQAAASTPVRDVFGDSITLTGINLYNRLNSLRLIAGLAPLDWPPAAEEVESLRTFTYSWNPTNRQLTLYYDPDPVPANRYLFIWATEPLNPGVAFVNHKLRLLDVVPPNMASPLVIDSAYTLRFGGYIPGKAIYFAAELVSAAGWKGPRTLVKVRIPGS
jgi:hypothetical protein